MPSIGIQTEVGGREHFDADKPYIVVANHQSNGDLVIGGSIVPNRTVSVGKKSLKWVPLFGQLYWLAGNVLIDRGNPRKAMEAMAITKEALIAKNTKIWFFAEGTRNKGKNMLPFKKGAFVTAINAGVPIIPVCCSSYLDGFDINKWDNGVARLRVLPAVSTAGYTQENVQELMDELHATMLNNIKQLDGLRNNQSESAYNA